MYVVVTGFHSECCSWGRWDDIFRHACFKRKLGINDVIAITRAMVSDYCCQIMCVW